MKTPTVLKQRTLHPSRFRELSGCHFRRLAVDIIEVWRAQGCYNCHDPISLSTFSCTCEHDIEPLAYGLKLHQEGPPQPGYYPYTGAMPKCAKCIRNWREPAREGACNGAPFE